MARPSQSIDQLLPDAGLALWPLTGCAGLSARRLTEHAGVNLGMFHYHFKTRENFTNAVLQRTYKEMFTALTMRVDPAHPPLLVLSEQALVQRIKFALRGLASGSLEAVL